MGLDAVLDTIVAAVNAAINAAGIAQPDQVGKGEPPGPDLVAILKRGGWIVSVNPMPTARDATRYPSDSDVHAGIAATLTATAVGNVVTFTGSADAGQNAHVFLDSTSLPDVAYSTIAGDTPSTVASALAARIVALGLAGVSATASAGMLAVTGVNAVGVSIGGPSGDVLSEVGRTIQDVQVTVWASNPTLRAQAASAIKTRVGAEPNRFLALAGGGFLGIEFGREGWNDSAQSSYGVYTARITYTIEFPELLEQQATPIASVVATVTQTGSAPSTYTSGGSS